MPIRHALMVEEAAKRLRAAEMLQQAGDETDSGYLLRLLALELLLKVAVEQATGERAPLHHRYHELFALLPQGTRRALLRVAGERIGPSGLSCDPAAVLKDLGANFVSLRYPHDKYGDLTRAEYEQLGVEWLARGGKVADADFRYHPEELFGLLAALRRHIGEHD